MAINSCKIQMELHMPIQGFIWCQKYGGGGKVWKASGRICSMLSLGMLWDMFVSKYLNTTSYTCFVQDFKKIFKFVDLFN